MTFHTRKCEVCEGLFTFKTNRKDLKDLWRCVECRKVKAVEETNPVGREYWTGSGIDRMRIGHKRRASS